jgi:LPXTG-site transpeptidase (sortase) family protein
MSKTTQIEPNDNPGQVERLLLILGLLALNVFVWSMVRTAYIQRRENKAFEEAVKNLEDRPSPFADGKNCAESRGPCGPTPAGKNSLVGRLSIPRLNLNAIVREGDGAGTLSVALGHIPGTAMPGELGNVGVAGHRDTLFRPLSGIRRNDTILFETVDRTYQYRVENIQIVKPSDVAVLGATKSPELTLVTCYPFYYVGAAPERYIVKAKMVPLSAHASYNPLHHTGSLVAMQNDER